MNKYISVLILIATLALSSCNIYKTIDVGDINDVKFKGLVDNVISLDLKVPITNPNNFKLKIKKLDLDISVNGKHIGKMINDTLIVVPKKFEGVVNFPVEIQVENILSSAMSFYKLKNARQVDIGIEGNITARSFLKNKTIKVSEKQTINLKEKMKKFGL